ncbi:hypothetical protein [Novosphingobium sp. TCA1]|uniref:hypothetical protein n=1 Tax=Novosphingobium sp. TCA1 TaxID=2682474 RepID=UPI00135C2370|nr:hypothetical protein [Novosphingobium sp. TCA1]
MKADSQPAMVIMLVAVIAQATSRASGTNGMSDTNPAAPKIRALVIPIALRTSFVIAKFLHHHREAALDALEIKDVRLGRAGIEPTIPAFLDQEEEFGFLLRQEHSATVENVEAPKLRGHADLSVIIV